MAGELIGRLRVEDMDGVHAVSGRRAIERDALEIDPLGKAAAWLKREPGGQVARSTLIGRRRIVERGKSCAGIGVHVQPPEQLRVALHPPSVGLESLAGKRFV